MNRFAAYLLLSMVVLQTPALSSPAVADPFVTLDSLAGKAAYRRAGRDQWQDAGVGLRLYNNDMIKVRDSSTARLNWRDGGMVFLHPNSQMLVNLHADTSSNLQVNHATVFFGAVFFVIKKALPRAMQHRQTTKIYTPTAVLSIRGTSFEVNVNPENGATDVRVINGTVLVGNILKKESVFLSAGYQTSIAMNADPVVPKPLMDTRLDSLKAWVPPEVIGFEIRKQTQEAEQAKRIIADKLIHKLVIVPFENTSDYHGAWDLTTAIPRFLAARLSDDHKPLQVEVAARAEKNLLTAGKANKSRFVLSGEIRGFDITKRAEIAATADKYREYAVARVRLRLQLVDVDAGKMAWEGDITGEVSGTIIDENLWPAISKKKLDLGDKEFSSTILAGAIGQALSQSSSQIARYLER